MNDAGPKTIHEIREESMALQVGNMFLHTYTVLHTQVCTVLYSMLCSHALLHILY